MHMEAIKISPKKNGKGYISGYSVSIAAKEIKICGLNKKRIVKIIDEEKGQIIIKEKRFSLSTDVINKVIELKNAANYESDQVSQLYYSNKKAITPAEMMRRFIDEHSGRVGQIAKQNFLNYLNELSMEEITDLTLLMCLGRDFDANTYVTPGEERFLEFYDRYGHSVQGISKDILIYTLDEKTPLAIYLQTGLRILNLPIGTSLDTIMHDWDEVPGNTPGFPKYV